MTDADLTLTTPVSAAVGHHERLLGLTILLHPDATRIGQQCIGPAAAGAILLQRFAPVFCAPGQVGAALDHRCVARAPTAIVRHADDTVSLTAPASRMLLEVDGCPLTDTVQLSAEQVQRGVVVALGGAVLLCLHWMRCLPKLNPLPGMLGVSSSAVQLREQIRQAANAGTHVLLLGETGTGKEVAAQAIHASSARRARPFIAVNIAALSESLAAADLFGAAKGAYTGAQAARPGLFAEADDGTLFLDEIGNAPALVQPMLLRVLENGEYRPLGGQRTLHARARLITATDQSLQAGTFNQALLRRLEGFVICLSPLRERREDIGLLLQHFLPADTALPFDFIHAACRADWPGNIRQLAQVARRAAIAVQAGLLPVLADYLDRLPAVAPDTAPPPPERDRAPRRKLDELSDDQVLVAMDSNGWKISSAASQLGISRPSLYKLLDTHPQVRRAESIPAQELRQALAEYASDLNKCASRLRTPGEALRRHLRASGLI